MKIDLATMAKRAGYRRDAIELAPVPETRAQVASLYRLYAEVLQVWNVSVRDEIVPLYTAEVGRQRELRTDSVEDIEIAVASTDGRAVQAILSFRGKFTAWARRFSTSHLSKIVARLKYATNVDLSSQMFTSDVQMTLDDLLARNVALVRDISDQARGHISDIVYRGLQRRAPVKDVAKEISEALGMGKTRATLIARDQASKLAAALDQDRQQQLGMDSFEWMHSRKARPRLIHVERDGNIYRWDSNIARTDPPGFAPYCGCKAKGILRMT